MRASACFAAGLAALACAADSSVDAYAMELCKEL